MFTCDPSIWEAEAAASQVKVSLSYIIKGNGKGARALVEFFPVMHSPGLGYIPQITGKKKKKRVKENTERDTGTHETDGQAKGEGGRGKSR